MGRSTPTIRQSIEKLERNFRPAFKGKLRAFDELQRAWHSEMAAISYAESFTLTKLLILAAVVDNRRVLEELRRELDELRRCLVDGVARDQ